MNAKFKSMAIAVWARDVNGGIGYQNDLPWPRIKEDMKHFKEVTSGGIVVMGRKTFESIGSKPLPGRINVVLSQNPDFLDKLDVINHDNLHGFCHPSDVVAFANQYTGKTVYIIGGASIYKAFDDLIDGIHETVVLDSVVHDTSIPPIDRVAFRLTYGLKVETKGDVPDIVFQRWLRNSNLGTY